MMVGMADNPSTFAVTYSYVPDILDRRGPHRDAHLAWLREQAAAGRILLAGALLDPVDGGLLVVRGQDGYDVRRLLLDDPYARASLIVGVTIRPLGLAVGG
jgi:uncharacterized protein YciI